MSEPHLTVCYITNRRFPCVQWFIDSLRREMETDADRDKIKIIVVDFYHDEHPDSLPAHVLHVPPKPCVWNGPHRLTTKDYFAASNARNTGICLAPDGWIAYVDDLSVLLPGWLACVRQAMREGYMVCGAYRKVYGLEVTDGVVQSFVDYKQGHDSRWHGGSDKEAVKHGAGILFGCSLAGPVETFLAVNGWEEKCDGMGHEDVVMGTVLTKRGVEMRYDRRMMTYEAEELHHTGTPMVRVDKKMVRYKDASHAILDEAAKGDGRSKNALDIRALRARVLAGEPFPIPTEPTKHWPDGQYLSTM